MAHDEGSTQDLPASDPQEITFLKPRAGTPWSAGQAREHVRLVLDVVVSRDKEAARSAARIGSYLREQYARFTERVFGEAFFVPWACRHYDLTRTDVYDFIKIALYLTDDQAGWLGLSHARRAVRLVELFKYTSLDPLVDKPLTTLSGETFVLPGTVAQLDSAIARIEKTRTRGRPEPKSLREEAEETNAEFGRAVAAVPALEGLDAGFYPRRGEVLFRANGVTKAQVLALAKVLAKIGKR